MSGKIWLGLGGVVVCAAAVWGVMAYRSRALPPDVLLKRLPAKDSLVVAVDFAGLRKLGLLQMLAGPKIDQEPDYAKFVSDTHFNYAQDLDYVLAAFGGRGKFILAEGRFDWSALRSYALKQGGECSGSVCKMAGSTPERRISFLPVQSNVMALAVSTDDNAALVMQAAVANTASNIPTPDAAVWLYLPPAILKSPGQLPEGTVLFARSVDEAKSVTIGFGSEGDHVSAKLNVLCNSDQDALMTTAELTKVTEVLRSVIAHAGQHPNPSDWSGVLTSGKFENKGSRVFGYWPIQRAFFENLVGAQGLR
ncbi:MAG TPA: hypothetical protein VHW24_08225 [Bryobacteraceae bacterium]|nr:hypothetical protein [Bryobacteraceae bacterium]